ncbi:MAG: aminoglycoside phosphotransferase family protein [Micrococcales bacterium]|nr:aminoglycoside phosphotransferase family protein [Micrococcales bacterium]
MTQRVRMTRRARPTWPDLPAAVRAAIEARLGVPVVGWSSRDGGYSPGLASVLTTPDGDVFVKATGPENDVSACLYRDEARLQAVLPAGVPAPRWRWLLEVPDEGWVALAFDAVPGHAPHVPWLADELDAVLDLARRIASFTAPAGALPDMAAGPRRDGWDALAQSHPAGLATYDPWVARNLERLARVCDDYAAAAAGSSLVHGDLRGDNALVVPASDGGLTALAVDWPCASRGAVFLDLVGMLPAVTVEGGPLPEDVLARHPLPPGTDEDAVTCYLAVLTGYFLGSSLDPPPPGIPHVREFQRAQAQVCVAWLRRRLRA